MDLIVLTPDKKIYEGKVTKISVPGVDGEFEILDNHAPLVSSLGEGKVIFVGTEDKNAVRLSIQNGFVEVLNNNVSILVQEAKS